MYNKIKAFLSSFFAKDAPPVKRGIATVLAVVAIFALLEAGTRVFYDPVVYNSTTMLPTVPNAYYMYQMKPDLSDEKSSLDLPGPSTTTNQDGFRGDRITAKKPPGAFRILCLGDSVTFGGGNVSDNETYPYYLKWNIHRDHPGRRIQVINAGCPGYTSVQGLELLKRKGLSYDPDIIIVGFVHHEHLFARKTDLQQMTSAPESVRYIKSLLYRSSFYLMIRRIVAPGTLSMSHLAGAPGDMQNTMQNEMVMRVPVEYYKKTLQEFIDLAASKKISLIFLSLPNPDASTRQQENEHLVALREIVDENKSYFIDLEAEFCRYKENYQITLMRDFVHPNAPGNKVMADIIDEYIKKCGLITEEGK